LLWNSLNQIPLEYREPLVLFYREDLSVSAVAEQLELSQDVVKQRLSRGRKMLKQEIETMVEDFLVDSKPAGQFTAGVIAALPAVSATAKAAAILVHGGELETTSKERLLKKRLKDLRDSFTH